MGSSESDGAGATPQGPQPGWKVPAISHSFLTDWIDGTGPGPPFRTPTRTLTCDSELRSPSRTDSIDLRICEYRPCHIRATHDGDRRSTTVTTACSLQAPSRTEPYHRGPTGPRHRSSKLGPDGGSRGGLAPPIPPLVWLRSPRFFTPTVLRRRGRIFPAPARGTPPPESGPLVGH